MRYPAAPLAVIAALAMVSAAGPACGQVCGTLADAFIAEEVGLRREWVVQLPFDSAASRLEQIAVGEGIVVAVAGDGSLHGVATGATVPGQPMPGTLLWSRHFGRAEGALHTPAIGSGIVFVAGSLHAFAIDVQTGRTVWEEPLSHPPTAAPVVSGDWVYLPVEGGRLIRWAVNPYRTPQEIPPPATKGKNAKPVPAAPPRSLTVEERIKPLSISARGRVELAPLPFQRGVLWCTTDGLITALQPAQPEWQRNEFDLGRPPAGGLLIRDKTIFATTNAGRSAGDVIRIELLPTGLVYRWRAPLGDSVVGDMRIAGDTLLVPLATGGLAGLSAEDGSRLWMHEQQIRLLTITSQRLWCIDAMGRLVTLDPADGRRMEQFCLGPFGLPVVNAASDRLVLASPGGIVASLAPRSDGTPTAAGPEPAEAPVMPGP